MAVNKERKSVCACVQRVGKQREKIKAQAHTYQKPTVEHELSMGKIMPLGNKRSKIRKSVI
jgi:hypothetical protein